MVDFCHKDCHGFDIRQLINFRFALKSVVLWNWHAIYYERSEPGKYKTWFEERKTSESLWLRINMTHSKVIIMTMEVTVRANQTLRQTEMGRHSSFPHYR